MAVNKRLNHLLKTGNRDQLRNYLKAQHPADIAAAIARMRPEDILFVLETVSNTRSVEVFANLEKDTQKACITFADPERVLHYFEGLSPDDQADLFRTLPSDDKEQFLGLLAKAEREDLLRLSRYEEDTAGAAMTTEFFSLSPDSTVAEALERIRTSSQQAETIYVLYIADPGGRLRGVVSLKDLVLAAPDTHLNRVMNPNVITVSVDEDVEEVARKIARYDLLALPVVNANKELRGIITVDDVLDIVEDEATEDIYAMAAVGAPMEYLNASVFQIWRQRIPWLLLLVMSGFVAGFVIEFFKTELSKFVELIFFIPLLMGSGGNAGTQASTVVIRAIAMGELTPSLFARVLWKEMRVGLMVGFCMGALAAFRAFFLPASSAPHYLVALTVGGTMFFVVTVAKCTGSMLPLVFQKLRLDPALMSNPLIQSIMDIVTLTLYFTLARFLLPF